MCSIPYKQFIMACSFLYKNSFMICCDVQMLGRFNPKGYNEATTANVIEGSNFKS